MPVTGLNADCEQYRTLVNSYFGEYTDQALFVSTKEASCQNIRSKKANRNGTYDYCIFQINNEASALDINTCVRRAWEKFKGSGYVWQQWYAVCPKDKKTGKQYQKFTNIPCFKK